LIKIKSIREAMDNDPFLSGMSLLGEDEEYEDEE